MNQEQYFIDDLQMKRETLKTFLLIVYNFS